MIRARFVVESKIPNDIGTCRVGSPNLGLAVEKSVRLIEIGGLDYVRGDELVILVNLRDAVHLNGEKHRDPVFFQLTSQVDGFRAAPAMAENDDVGILFLVGRESPIPVRVQQIEDFLSRLFPAVAFKGLYVHPPRGKPCAGALRAALRYERDYRA